MVLSLCLTNLNLASMPKDKRSNTKGQAKVATGPQLRSTLESLQKASASTVKDHRHSKNTRIAYDGYITRGRGFLMFYCDADGNIVVQQSSSETAGMLGEDYAKPWLDPLFPKAFDDKPNKYSPEALDLFITSKCVNEGCKKSTAESICASFRKLWDESYVTITFVI